MGRIVCVSNRVSLPDPETGEIRAGGLAVGVRAALESQGGGVWFGWNGAQVAHDGERGQSVQKAESNGITFLTIPLTEREYSLFYKKMANEGLWPFMHELHDHIGEEGAAFRTYLDVNVLFARYLRLFLQPDDTVWVHDYHLIPLGHELRKLGINNRILFFNHIPIPGPDFIGRENVPESLRRVYKYLVNNLFSYDQVGFQSFRDYRNFMDYLGIAAPGPRRFSTAGETFGPRGTRIGVYPISIETADLEARARASARRHEVRRIRGGADPCHIIIGAERLDYTKGLLQRIQGVARLFEEHPEYSHRIKYIQVTPLSRSDIREYRLTIDRTRAAIDHMRILFGDREWQPVQYSEQTVPRDDLMGYFHHARVGLVTPLMDGQNLVAKEFLAAQDPADPGVLVLSKHAGAAEELHDIGAALLVDPRDPGDIADKIDMALRMPHRQRMNIHRRAIAYLRQYDINHWAKSFLAQEREEQIPFSFYETKGGILRPSMRADALHIP